MEKYLVCPKCGKIVRLIEPTAEICFRANQLLKGKECTYGEALRQALDELRSKIEDNTHDSDPAFNEVIDKHFWDLA